jgi:hypothetical protein
VAVTRWSPHAAPASPYRSRAAGGGRGCLSAWVTRLAEPAGSPGPTSRLTVESRAWLVAAGGGFRGLPGLLCPPFLSLPSRRGFVEIPVLVSVPPGGQLVGSWFGLG